MPLRKLRGVLALAITLLAGPASVAGPTAAAAAPTSAATLTGRLHAAADRSRLAAGRETLFTRGTYLAAAQRMTAALLAGTTVPRPPDAAPSAHLGGVAIAATLDTEVAAATAAVVGAAGAVLAYPLHTDGGWSVATQALADGRIRYGVALVVGWPDPAITSDRGCSTSGYCWSNRGVHPHLPWTRNTITWYLSTANLPPAGESLVKTAIANLNRVSGFGADLVYGGKTSATTASGSARFLVVWGSGCASTAALACTIDGTQGSYHLVYQARIVVTRARYLANPSTGWWVGTLMHEMAHALGMEHYDGTYLGRHQLMRWANGPDVLQPGDVNGLRRIAPPGRLSVSLRLPASAGSGTSVAAVVHAANAGLGGLRSLRVDCTDRYGVWRTVRTAAGRWDGKARDHRMAWTAAATAPYLASCRAVMRSKTATATSATVRTTLGG